LKFRVPLGNALLDGVKREGRHGGSKTPGDEA
jgi:hypothetical protein